MLNLLFVVIGFFVGIISGSFGVGCGIVLVPILVLVFKLSQLQAQGTALAVMMLPVFFLAVWRYYQAGHVNVSLALFVAVGFTFGALVGAHFVQAIPEDNLKKAFGILLVLVGLRMVFLK